MTHGYRQQGGDWQWEAEQGRATGENSDNYTRTTIFKKVNEKEKKPTRISMNELRQLQVEEEGKLRKDAIALFSSKT